MGYWLLNCLCLDFDTWLKEDNFVQSEERNAAQPLTCCTILARVTYTFPLLSICRNSHLLHTLAVFCLLKALLLENLTSASETWNHIH
jgi:hypothetical protein